MPSAAGTVRAGRTIENNEIEGASENILIGGADPSIVGLVPTDITIRGNHLFKRLAWRGAGVGVKNLLELKTGRRVRIENNCSNSIGSTARPAGASS